MPQSARINIQIYRFVFHHQWGWSGLEAMLVTALMKPHKWAAKCIQEYNGPKTALHECFSTVLISRHINDPLGSVHSPQALICTSAYRSQMPITRFFLFAHWNWLFSPSLPQEINLFTPSSKQPDNYFVNYTISFDIQVAAIKTPPSSS